MNIKKNIIPYVHSFICIKKNDYIKTLPITIIKSLKKIINTNTDKKKLSKNNLD